jgi:nucleotide sugar dehydrogenase
VLNRAARIAVLGQGYVGLSVACRAADAGFTVTGIDVDERRVTSISKDLVAVAGVRQNDLDAALATGRLTFTTDMNALAAAQVALICVPTPLRDDTPDLSFVERACEAIARHLPATRLVVLESTTYPGTTDGLVLPLLERSGCRSGRDFLLAYSPERIDPGNEEFSFWNVPRIVGGTTPQATSVAALFYEQLVEKVMVVSSCRAAELAKLLENTYRHVNIALVNEMAMICHEMGIDVWEVVDAAATKPFGFMRFVPGPGVGGHCIPLDPTYLAWQVRREAGHQFRILEEARDVNAQMPRYAASRIAEALNDRGKAVRGSRVLVVGVTYKPDVGDVRESPAIGVMAALRRMGAALTFHDPFVTSIDVGGTAVERAELTPRALSQADCVALLSPHRSYDLDAIARHADLIFDARNAFGADPNAKVVRL